MNYFVEI